MADYIYECINRQGEIVKGKISADNNSIAIDKLKKMELMIVDLKQMDTTVRKTSGLFQKKVSIGELAMFSKQMAAMLNAGIPVTRALFTIGQQATNPTLKAALITIAQNVEGGRSLTDAFSMYPKIFSDLYISMLHSGEVGGILDDSLTRLADQLQKEKVLIDNIKASTFYPRMVAGFALILFVAMLVFMVPIFKGFIPENAAIPAITAMIFSLSDSIRGSWFIWIAVLAVFVFVIYIFVRSPAGKRIWESIKFKIPAFGPIMHKAVLARFSRTLATLLEGGIPIIQALEGAGPTSGSLLVNEVINNTVKKIEEGKNISDQLKESYLFPPMMIQMIAVGEETGSLSSMLDKMAEFYEDEVTTLTKGITALIEPIMLVIVGLIIGSMIIALYLPIFTAITQSGY
ncbi:MAG TPA: type II secretion system F family protein [Clostridiales bacterium]|nr:type II secretion system F family protein [Clostridiales bacterium]